MAVSSNSVFISYRRSANPYLALAVYQDLRANGIDTFYDVEDLDTGQFDSIILNQISARVYFMPIFTPGTLDRCVEAGDWVRREIEHAMNEDRRIVPLHTPDFDFGDIDKFLTGLIARELKRWKSTPLAYEHFRLVMRNIRERILNPIDISVNPVPKADELVIARKQAQAASEPTVTEKQLTAPEYFDSGLISKDLDQEIEDLTKYIESNPFYRSTSLPTVREMLTDYEPYGVSLAHDIIRLAKTYIARGRIYAAKRDYNAAIVDFQIALRLRPDHPVAEEIQADIEKWERLI